MLTVKPAFEDGRTHESMFVPTAAQPPHAAPPMVRDLSLSKVCSIDRNRQNLLRGRHSLREPRDT